MTALVAIALAATTIYPPQPHAVIAPTRVPEPAAAASSLSPPALRLVVLAPAEDNAASPGPTPQADAAPQPASTTTEPATTPPTDRAHVTAAGLAALRACESGGNYRQVGTWDGHPSIYTGAYQFDQRTWDDIARRHARADLAGAPSAAAPPADQDLMATLLWAERGPAPWPVCGPKALGR